MFLFCITLFILLMLGCEWITKQPRNEDDAPGACAFCIGFLFCLFCMEVLK